MVAVAQLVRASDCGPEGRRFDPGQPPNKKTLKSQQYPLTKLLYFITREEKFGLANGFIRYSCTSIGQKIVNKEGLQPYFLFPRTVKINTQK